MKNCLTLFLLLLLLACNPSKDFSLKDQDLLIQGIKKVDAQDPSTINFMVRIFPDKNKTEQAKDFNAKMQLNMDSCFYTFRGEQRIYADQIIPVSSGVKGCFEYLVAFDGLEDETHLSTLVYQDKYINQKIYQLNF